MPDHILTDDDCARIVAASIDPGRVLGGIDGHDGGAADALLTTVEGIVGEHTAALRDTNARLNRRAQTAEAAINELTTGTGGGKLRPLAREMWARCQTTHERGCGRAEAAEAELARLREGIRALLRDHLSPSGVHYAIEWTDVRGLLDGGE